MAAHETLPWSWYSDPEVLSAERERIFSSGWQYAGHTGLVERSGDHFPCTAGHVPVVIVRDEDGDLRAFLNVCRHRGSEVVRGPGNRKTLQCPYHAWTYGLDGELRTAPRSEREPGFDGDGLSLVPVALATWGPLVFVNPDAGAAPLTEALGPVPQALAEGGVDVEALVFDRRLDYELDANWKIVIENYLECYHCPVAHPGFSREVDVDPDSYVLEPAEWTSSQYARARNGAGRPGQFHFLWPNTRINVFPGPVNLSIGPTLPRGPARTSGFFDYFFAADVSPQERDELVEFDSQVGREDRALVESVQRGTSSGMLDRGRLLPLSEQLIEHFQRLVAQALD